MAVNKTLRFVLRDPKKHMDSCAICGRLRLKRQAVMAIFAEGDPPVYSAPYCFTCIRQLFKTMRGTAGEGT